jgi:hypothetical protein
VIDENDVKELYRRLHAPVVEFDCGQKCAEINGGIPICCDDAHAIPVLYRSEITYLKKKTDLWRGFRPYNDHERNMARELPDDQRFARCKGHTLCERENRSFACRTFPFFPYFTRREEFFGLSYYWEYRGRCWILERHDLVRPDFVTGFVRAWELVFERKPDEADYFASLSATCRGAHTRMERDFVVLDRAGKAWLRKPGKDGLEPAPAGPTGPPP